MPIVPDQLETLNTHKKNKTIAHILQYHDTVVAKQLIIWIKQAVNIW